MYCKICGYTSEEDLKICPICGNILNETPNEREETPTDDAEEGTSVLKADDTEDGTSVLKTEDDEEGTSVLKADEAEDGTTVLTNNAMQGPNRTPQMMQAGQGRPPQMMQTGMMQSGQRPPQMMQTNQRNPQMAQKAKTKTKPAKADNKKKQKKKGKGGKLALIIVLAVLVLLIAVAAILIVPRVINYNKAEDAFAEGNVEEAIELYRDAAPYKNSDDMANGGAYYEYAKKLYDEGNYSEAAVYYGKAAESTYSDAEEMEKTCYGYYADELYDAGDYETAVTYYEMVGDDSETTEKINKCKYQIACNYMSTGSYDEAIEAFEELGAYEDSADKIKECYYNQATAKMEAGEYEEARELFIKSETSDSEAQANKCLYMIATQYVANKDYESAIETFSQIDATYVDCSADMENAYLAWGDMLVEEKDYKTAIDKYSNVNNDSAKKKIKKAKAAYIDANFTMSDETTMSYLCDLKYADYGSAESDYTELTGWSTESFVNYKEEDIDAKKDSVKSSKDIYIHTLYSNSNDATMNVYANIIYSDGSKSNSVNISGVSNDKATWLKITSGTAPTGTTTVYIYDSDTNYLIEKYTFTIK